MSVLSINLENVEVSYPVFGAPRSVRAEVISTLSPQAGFRKNQPPRFIQALRSINLSLGEGERLAILGRNGSGKTTLLRVLAGVLPPTSGKLEVEGTRASILDVMATTYPEATGRENVFLRAALSGLPIQIRDHQIQEILDFAELGDFADLPVRTYSSGMKIRLAVSAATYFAPSIFILDEWLSVGDERFRRKIQERLAELLSSSKIFVLATHDQQLARAVCNRAIVLENGEIRSDGDIDSIADSYFN